MYRRSESSTKQENKKHIKVTSFICYVSLSFEVPVMSAVRDTARMVPWLKVAFRYGVIKPKTIKRTLAFNNISRIDLFTAIQTMQRYL